MKLSRRDLGILLPALVASGATTLGAQQAPAAAAAADNSVEKLPVMKTQHFKYDALPVTNNGKNRRLSILVREGAVELTVAGKAYRLVLAMSA